MPNIRESFKDMVLAWLQKHGFDGLYNEEGCACRAADLMPCGSDPEDLLDCIAGKYHPCENCGFHISSDPNWKCKS